MYRPRVASPDSPGASTPALSPRELSSAQAGPAALPICAAIVCKNNVATLPDTLRSVRSLCTEILAVDSGSTDGTLELLASFGARVIRSPWLGHVRTKQVALESAAQPWVLCIDSDESVLADLDASIRGLIGPDGSLIASPLAAAADHQAIAGFAFIRKVYYRGRPLEHAWQPEWRTRLVRAGRAAWGGIDPHDVLAAKPPGLEVRIPGTLRHDSISTFAEFIAKQLQHARTSADGLHARGVRSSTWQLLVRPPAAMLKQLVLKQAFRDGVPGWLAAASSAVGTLMKHAALLEKDLGSGAGLREEKGEGGPLAPGSNRPSDALPPEAKRADGRAGV